MLLALLCCLPAQAGPWVKGPKEAYLKGGYVRFAASEYVDPTTGAASSGGTTDSPAPRYVGNTWHLYGEVGLVEPVQVVFNLPFVASHNVDGEVIYANRAFGDAELGLAAGHRFGDWPVSLTVKGKLPLYDNADLLRYGYVGDRFPAIGDGQVDLTAMVAIGRGLRVGGQQGWTALEAGYQYRSEWWLGDSSEPDRQLLDSVPWHAQVGWSPRRGDRALGWLAVDAMGVQRLGANAYTRQWVQAGVGGGATITRGLTLELGGSVTPIAVASSKGWSLSMGVSWQR